MAHSDDRAFQARSATSLTLRTEPVTAPSLSRTDLAGVFARLTVVYGDTRIADRAQRELLLREWAEALGSYAPGQVHEAVGKWIKLGKYWPTPSEIREIIRADAPPVQRPAYRAADPSFCRDGRTVEEELAHRRAHMAELRRRYPSVFDRAG